MRRLTSLTTALLIFFQALTPGLAWSHNHDSNDRVSFQESAEQKKVSGLLAAIAQARSESDPAPRLTAQESNLHFLRSQSLRVNNSEITLGYNPLRLPSPEIKSTEKDLSFEVFDGALVIIHRKTGAQHKVLNLQAESITADDSLIYVKSKAGTVHAILKRFIKEFAFNTPIPVFKVAQIQEPGEFKMVSLAKPLNQTSPYALAQEMPAETKFQKGDLLFLNQKNEVSMRIDASFMREIVFLESLMLSLFAVAANPQQLEKDGFIRETLAEGQKHFALIQSRLADPELKSALQESGFLDILASTDSDTVKRVTNQALEVRMEGQVEAKLSLQEWEESFEKMRSELRRRQQMSRTDRASEALRSASRRMQDTSKNLFKGTENFLKKAIHRDNIFRLTKTLAVLAGAAAIDNLTGSHVSQWAISLGAKMYHLIIPDVLLDPKLRWPTLQVDMILMTSLPVFVTLGFLGSKFTSWNVKKTMAVAGLRAWGAAQGILYYPIRYLLRQKNLLPGMLASVDPVRDPRLSNSIFASDQKIAQNAEAVNADLLKRNKAELLAGLIAYSVVSGKEGIDTWSLVVSEIDAQKKLGDKERKEWVRLGAVLQRELEGMPGEKLAELINGVDPHALHAMILKAQELRLRLQDNPVLKRELLKRSEAMAVERSAFSKGAGYFVYEAHHRLMNAEPSAPIYNHYLRRFSVDYIFGLLFYSFWGGRADLSKPQDLVHDPKGPLGINRSHLADVADWNTYYLMGMPAALFLDYDNPNGAKKDAAEEWHIEINPRTGRFFETGRQFLVAAIDLPRANYGYYVVRTLKQSLWTLPAVITVGTLSRVGFLGVAPDQAAMSAFWVMMTSMWAYAWPWVIVDRGTIGHETQVRANWEHLQVIYFKLEKAVAEKNDAVIHEGVQQILEIYNRNHQSAPSSFGKGELEFAIELLKTVAENPPVPQKPNESFLKFVTGIGSFITTYFATYFSLSAFDPTADWGQRLLMGVPVSLALYASVALVQKGINRYWDPFLAMTDRWYAKGAKTLRRLRGVSADPVLSFPLLRSERNKEQIKSCRDLLASKS